MPVDICAGRGDGIIAKENVLMHYEAMRAAGCRVTYKEFDFGHLDFTFAGACAEQGLGEERLRHRRTL